MSTKRRIYLDFNATAPLVDAARDAMVEAMADVGNPSSVHTEGRRARNRVERARRQVAELVGRPREQIVFTSGGTEANWLGVMGLAAIVEERGLPKIVATTPIEHPSLRGPIDALQARGWRVAMFPATSDYGVIELGDVAEAGLVAAGLANHEIGTILGDDILKWARQTGALIHLDAVQAAGKIAIDKLDVDSIAISAHKIGGPQGVGALAISVDTGLPLVEGGHQERGRRPGTENVLGIIGFGAAAAHIDMDSMQWTIASSLGDTLANLVVEHVERVRIHGRYANRVGTTMNLGFEGALGETIVMALDLAGIAVSTGAACTSGSVQPSAVLLGLGFGPDQAREAVRFSFGPSSTIVEVAEVIRVLPAIVERARRHR